MAITLSSVYQNAHTHLYTHESTGTCVYTQPYTFLWLCAYRHIHIRPALAAPAAADTGDSKCATMKTQYEELRRVWGRFRKGTTMT